MASRVGVDLEVVAGGVSLSLLEHAGTKSHHRLMGRVEVLDPQVQVDSERGVQGRRARLSVARRVAGIGRLPSDS